MNKLTALEICEGEYEVINPNNPKYDEDDREAFPSLKRKNSAEVWKLDCGHFVDTITLFGVDKKCFCPVCNQENPEPKDIKIIKTINSYLCWDCEFHWIADILSNQHHWGKGYLQCGNCGSINIIRKERRFHKNWPSLTHECFKRDGYKCKECGATNKETRLHCDHIIPVDQGGTDELENLQTLCEKCNLQKSNCCWIGGNNEKD